MSYAEQPYRRVALKQGERRYAGPKNWVVDAAALSGSSGSMRPSYLTRGTLTDRSIKPRLNRLAWEGGNLRDDPNRLDAVEPADRAGGCPPPHPGDRRAGRHPPRGARALRDDEGQDPP